MGLRINDVSINYGETVAVANVSFDVADGEVVALLGASGSGKSTLLRAIAGLEPLQHGSLYWDDQDLADVKVHKRNFGLVFQDGQLFPTMNVGRNIGYGLHQLPRAQRAARVQEMLDLVGLAGYQDRRVSELSGGQAQRVALARSLAPTPRALLLDEPLSALDTGLRRRLADELAQILHQTNTTAVYVTHDHQEAYTVADRVAVLAHGQLLQIDTPERLRSYPVNRDVATFLGYTAFLTQTEAASLGWQGQLSPGMVAGVGPMSLALAGDGVELEVVRQTLTVDDVEIKVVLPGGQSGYVRAPKKVSTATVRVRLIDIAEVPA